MKTWSEYTIQAPIWNGNTNRREIGIAEYRLPCYLEISYTDRFGNKMYPDKFPITKDFASKYPVKVVGANTKLRIIPINDLETLVDTKE
jgi:hypothetical protein